MQIRSCISLMALLSLLVLAVAGAALASARYVQPTPAQSGRYGGLRGVDELIGFKVLPNRTVKAFSFNTPMECHNSDTGEDYVRDFDAHNIGGGKVDFDGKWRHEYEAESGLRQGSGVVEVEFRRSGRVFASASVLVVHDSGAFESCNGFLFLKVRRGPLS